MQANAGKAQADYQARRTAAEIENEREYRQWLRYQSPFSAGERTAGIVACVVIVVLWIVFLGSYSGNPANVGAAPGMMLIVLLWPIPACLCVWWYLCSRQGKKSDHTDRPNQDLAHRKPR